MRRSSVTVHVGEETRARIEARTDPGESVEDWVRAAIHRRLDDPGDHGRSDDGDGDEETAGGGGDGLDRGRSARGDDDSDGVGYEFVDDCRV